MCKATLPALGLVTALLFGTVAMATTLNFANGNPGDWSSSYTGTPITVTTVNSGGPSGAAYTELPNLYPFGSSVAGAPDNGPYTFFGTGALNTAPEQTVSQSIAVYLNPAAAADQSGQFMLDETPNATTSNTISGTPQLWGAEEDFIVTGTSSGINVQGSGYSGSGSNQQFTSMPAINQAGWYDFQMTWVRLFSAARDSNVIKQLRVAEAGAMCSHRRYGVAQKLSGG